MADAAIAYSNEPNFGVRSHDTGRGYPHTFLPASTIDPHSHLMAEDMADVLYFSDISLTNQIISDSNVGSEPADDSASISSSVCEHRYRRRFDSFLLH